MILKIYLIGFITVLMAVSFGCKKTEDQNLNTEFKTVKVYDDTLADIRNHSINIAAGSNQLYMTYGVGRSLYFDYLNGLLNSGGFDEFNARLMATDLDGNLKWIKELPANRMADGILVLDDESVVVGTYTFSSYSTDFNLIRFNRNGEKIAEFTAPIASNVTGYTSIDLIRAFNGNIIVCGTYYRDGSSGYICEYDINLNQIWFKSYTGGITHVELAENNNYIFTQESYGDSSIVVLRANSTGDSLGVKYLKNIYNPICNDLVKNANGNYLISVSSGDKPNIKSYIYEIDQNGDLLYATATSFSNFNYNASLVPQNDGGVFALMQSYLYDEQALEVVQIFNEINSAYATFDAGLGLSSTKIFQSKTSDNLTAACSLPTGEIACFGLIKSEGKIYYKPELVILK